MQTSEAGPARRAAGERDQLSRWWWVRGEQMALALLVFASWLIPLLVLLGLLPLSESPRWLLVVAWLACGLLLIRLLRWLRSERRRAGLLAGLGGLALAGALAAAPGTTTRADAAAPLLAAALDARAAALAPASQSQGASPLTFVAPPRISQAQFAAVLQRGAGGGTSPAAPFADDLYAIFVGYGIDPGVALAFFAHESQLCTNGVCQVYDTKNWGNMRAAYKRSRVIDVVQTSGGPFVRYATWQDGARDWCELILNKYVARGLDTVAKAVPVYAPTSDGNVPTAYINAIHRTVAIWQGRDPAPAVFAAARSYREALDVALVKETFLASDLEYHATWAFHQYMLAEARQGRPLGTPLSESQPIAVGNKRYAVQVFALDTLYTPLADVESETNWGDVRRLSDLLKQKPAP